MGTRSIYGPVMAGRLVGFHFYHKSIGIRTKVTTVLQMTFSKCLLKENKYEQIFSPSNMTACQYFDEDEFIKKNRKSDKCLNIFALNIRSIPKHSGELLDFLKDLHTKFDVIVLTEIGSLNISVVAKLILDYNFPYVLPAKKKTDVVELVFTLVIHWPMLL